MSRLHVVFVILAVTLTGRSALAQNLGTPSLGWVTVAGPPAQGADSGFVDVGVYSYQVKYNYSPVDTAASVLAGLKAGFDNTSSPVTASIAGNVLVLTSKTIGSASNSSSLFAIVFGASFSTSTVGMIGGRDGPRNFRMFADAEPLPTMDADVNSAAYSFGDTGKPLPPGHSIIAVAAPPTYDGLDAWWNSDFKTGWDNLIAQNPWDVTRIDAVNVDEPYTTLISYLYQNGFLLSADVGGDPCAPGDPRRQYILQAYEKLRDAAAAIKQSSPTTRFWVNFEQHELDWMRNGSCASLPAPYFSLNAPYIDVVSLDYYQVDFYTTVQPYYDWLLDHPGYAGQQIALFPGTFVGRGSDPIGQALVLEEFFDYAANLNSACIMPLGSRAVTGVYDGCPVWLVAGFTYPNTADGYIGLGDPATAAVQAAWAAELSGSRVDHGLPAIQIFALQPVLN